jgi:uncharacterized protein (DUF1778 family)
LQQRRPSARATARVDARLTPEQKALIRHAAHLQSRSISDFVVANAYAAAEQVIRKHETIVLSVQESKRFADLLRNPPPPSARMLAAAEQYRFCVDE